MTKIVVTGGLGYIGSHTVVALQNKGFEVLIIDDLSNSNISVLEGIEKITNIKPAFFKIDLKNKELVRNFFKNNSVDGVIHFAASKAVGESVQNPLKYYENNLATLIYLLQEMQKNKVDNLIFSSSCTVYGDADKMPVTEKTPIKKAENAYGNTKQIGEEIIADTVKISKLKAIALRYFNPIGAHKSICIGELPIGVPQNLVPYITQTAIGIRKELLVFGNDYNTPDGTPIRDYLHVSDLAEAHVVAIKRLLDNKQKNKMEYFNIGTGVGSTVLDVIHSFEKVNNLKIPYRIAPRRKGDVTAYLADVSFANSELGWKSKRTLDDALRSAWQWQLKLKKDAK